MPEVIKRADALALGLKRYYTGKPCSNGHIAERYTEGHCVICDGRSRRTPSAEKKQRNQELAAQRRQEMACDALPRQSLARLGLAAVMDSQDARQRSEYLNRKIRHAVGLE